MEKVGIFVVSYGSREAAMVDTFARSTDYRVELYIADRQRNPLNVKRATKHVVIPDLNIEETCKFAETNKDRIDFGVVGPEKPIIDGIRDLIEDRTDIPMICPKKEQAIENSKVQQRLSFQQIVPEVNPRFKIFSPKEYQDVAAIKRAVNTWLDELKNGAVVKPDRPTAGKGVGVWGDHFTNREQFFEHFLSNYQYGTVIIEEKVEGEESSFQAFSDGKHLVPLPDTRDYKRAFDDDKGPNTGGMGSYKNVGNILPFLTANDRNRELEIAEKIFNKWRKDAQDDSALRGVPLYTAFMHGKETKILENNSRPGDPEITNIIPILKQDFIDICFRILEGNLTHVDVQNNATVSIYKVPPGYGGYAEAFPDLANTAETGGMVDLEEVYKLAEKYRERIRIYPGAMEQRGKQSFALKSRTVCVVGIEESIEEARRISLEGIQAIRGGGLWCRNDIASPQHIEKSIETMEKLRRPV